MVLSAMRELWGRSYVQSIVESGSAIYGMAKPLALVKPALAASAFYSFMVGAEVIVTVALLSTTIPLVVLQYRNAQLRKKLDRVKNTVA